MEPACASGSVASGHYCSLFEIVPKERRQRGADTRVAITCQFQSWIRPQFSDWQLQFRFLRCTHRNTLCHGHSCFRPRREFDLDRHRFCYGSRCLKFLADRGNRVAHFPDSALQIVGGGRVARRLDVRPPASSGGFFFVFCGRWVAAADLRRWLPIVARNSISPPALTCIPFN